MRKVLLLLLAACGADADKDGFGPEDDCDDDNGLIFPTAIEACNGVDDDCDGVIDPPGSSGTQAWYADRDADGWGDRTYVVKTCAGLMGFVATFGDCNDEDARVNPSVDEVPGDGVDGDCDTATPDDAP